MEFLTYTVADGLAANSVMAIAKLVDGKLCLEAPSEIPVRGNEFILGDKRIVVKWAGA